MLLDLLGYGWRQRCHFLLWFWLHYLSPCHLKNEADLLDGPAIVALLKSCD